MASGMKSASFLYHVRVLGSVLRKLSCSLPLALYHRQAVYAMYSVLVWSTMEQCYWSTPGNPCNSQPTGQLAMGGNCASQRHGSQLSCAGTASLSVTAVLRPWDVAMGHAVHRQIPSDTITYQLGKLHGLSPAPAPFVAALHWQHGSFEANSATLLVGANINRDQHWTSGASHAQPL